MNLRIGDVLFVLAGHWNHFAEAVDVVWLGADAIVQGIAVMIVGKMQNAVGGNAEHDVVVCVMVIFPLEGLDGDIPLR
jgi:hypothetical protein